MPSVPPFQVLWPLSNSHVKLPSQTRREKKSSYHCCQWIRSLFVSLRTQRPAVLIQHLFRHGVPTARERRPLREHREWASPKPSAWDSTSRYHAEGERSGLMCALTAPCVCICVYFYEWKDINKHITACKKTNRIDLEYRMNKGRNPAFKSFHCPFVPPDLCTKF